VLRIRGPKGAGTLHAAAARKPREQLFHHLGVLVSGEELVPPGGQPRRSPPGDRDVRRLDLQDARQPPRRTGLRDGLVDLPEDFLERRTSRRGFGAVAGPGGKPRENFFEGL